MSTKRTHITCYKGTTQEYEIVVQRGSIDTVPKVRTRAIMSLLYLLTYIDSTLLGYITITKGFKVYSYNR